ncbi:hypothetical protein F441_21084 [Phytophthora nicotianae CJ01A1]|uniref:Uncharacterized protein n=1 Tax=Phytophthora nicotianae CJ01A1 TaxID=1317063 RepID=W2VU81_PHYNI|nr:hypothetical protein F441_21084 [Phytophthora nicotianae CJ01A1]
MPAMPSLLLFDSLSLELVAPSLTTKTSRQRPLSSFRFAQRTVPKIPRTKPSLARDPGYLKHQSHRTPDTARRLGTQPFALHVRSTAAHRWYVSHRLARHVFASELVLTDAHRACSHTNSSLHTKSDSHTRANSVLHFTLLATRRQTSNP